MALLASGWRYHGPPRAAATLTVGAISGFLMGFPACRPTGSLFTIWPAKESVERVRANLTTYFVFVDLIALAMALAMFFSRDLVTWHTGALSLCLAPAVVLGGVVGERLFPLASEGFYRRLALVLLVVVAIGSLIL